jgi:hypothetical protein
MKYDVFKKWEQHRFDQLEQKINDWVESLDGREGFCCTLNDQTKEVKFLTIPEVLEAGRKAKEKLYDPLIEKENEIQKGLALTLDYKEIGLKVDEELIKRYFKLLDELGPHFNKEETC